MMRTFSRHPTSSPLPWRLTNLVLTGSLRTRSLFRFTPWKSKAEFSKASIVINILRALPFFSDPESMKKINDNLDKFAVLYDNKTIKVVYLIMKAGGPVSNQEVVAVYTVRVEGTRPTAEIEAVSTPARMTLRQSELNSMLEALSSKVWRAKRSRWRQFPMLMLKSPFLDLSKHDGN